MAISTSGVSVPQLGQTIDASIYGSQNAPKPMTIGDMLDISKKSLDLRKAKETYQPEIDYIKANAQQAQAANMQEQLKNVRSHVSYLTNQSADLLKEEELSPKKIAERYTEINKNSPGGEDPRALQQVLMGMPQPMQGETKEMYQTRLRSFVTSNMGKGLDNLAQFEKMFPATQQVNLGGQTVTTGTGNPDIAVNTPGVPTGPYIQRSISPQVVTNQITGAPTAFGGGGTPQAGNLNNRPVGVQVVPAGGGANVSNIAQTSNNLPVKTTNSASVVAQPQIQDDPLGKVEPLRQGANESPANFNARVGNVQSLYAKSQDQLSNPQSENGYIPQLKQVNSSIMTLLKDPEVRTGAVNDYLAGRTNKGTLSTKEQELAKYLEQRIQAKTPKSDADAESKRQSYGSFNLDKEALKSLTRQDNAYILTQELAARGRLNNARIGGTTNNPNFARVDAFNNKFAQLSSDPNLMQYIAIAGTNPSKIRIDSDDDKALKSLLVKMSPEERSQLELKRKTLLRMVGQ